MINTIHIVLIYATTGSGIINHNTLHMVHRYCWYETRVLVPKKINYFLIHKGGKPKKICKT